MATVSFSKEFIVKEPESVKKVLDIVSKKTVSPVDKSLTSYESMERGRDLLKKYLSH